MGTKHKDNPPAGQSRRRAPCELCDGKGRQAQPLALETAPRTARIVMGYARPCPKCSGGDPDTRETGCCARVAGVYCNQRARWYANGIGAVCREHSDDLCRPILGIVTVYEHELARKVSGL